MSKKNEQAEQEVPVTEEAAEQAAAPEQQDSEHREEPETPEEPEAPANPDSEEVPAELSEDEEAPVSAEEAPKLPAEVKGALEAEYPVLKQHGTHDAAMKGLQTDASGGYDRSKL